MPKLKKCKQVNTGLETGSTPIEVVAAKWHNAVQSFDFLPDAAFVTDSTLAVVFDVSKVTIWRWSRDGRLPAPRKLGANTTRWNVGQLREAIARLAAD